MNVMLRPYRVFFLLAGLLCFCGCKDIIEPSVSKYKVYLEAPADNYQSVSYTINFWWDEVADASAYHLQVVSGTFASPGGLVLDTVLTKDKFSFNLDPGSYQWRVQAQNGSSHTVYADPRSFTVAASSIKQQTIPLVSPGNGTVTNVAPATFSWGSLYGANSYRFELDTNNFADENAVVYTAAVPGQQLNYTFLKDHVYQWRVRGENDTAQSKWSVINSVTFDHTPPAAVTLLAPGNDQVAGLPVVLQWNKVSEAVKYKVYVYKSDSTTLYSNSFPVAGTGTSYTFNAGNSGDSIYWKVSAVDAAGNEGAASELRHFVLQ